MKRTYGRFAPGCVAVALLLVLAPWASAQVLQQVPADALVVIKFNKLKATNDKIAAMANKLGIAQFQPDFGDPLGAFKRESKIQNGLDENGEAAMVITSGPSQRGEPPMILLLPVSDYKAFLANFSDAKAEGEVTSFKLGGGNDMSYAVNWGKYAAIANRKEAVAQKPAGLKPAGVSAKELDEKDIVAYVNMQAARTKVLPAIAQGRQEFLRNMERGMRQGMGAQPPRRPGAAAPPPSQPPADAAAMKFMPVIRALVNRGFDVVEQIVTDANAATWGASITDDGIRLTLLGDFTASSPSGQQVAKLKGAAKSATVGLPQTRYLMFGGLQNVAALPELLQTFVAPIEKELAALGPDGKPLQDYLAAIKRGTAASKGGSFGIVMPSGALGQEAIFQMVSVNNGDAKAMMAAQKEIFQTQQAFMDMFSPPQMRGLMKPTFSENVKTVDGVTLNLLQMQFTPPAAGQPQNPQMMQMRQMMTWMYGPNGLSMYTGAIGNDKMIGAAGVTDATLQQLIAAAKANQDPLAQQPTVKSVSAQLPREPVLVAYIAIDNIATTVANYAKMFGMPINFQLPPNLAPIGFSIATDATALRADYYIPAQTVQSVVAAVIQTYMQMQGGQQPGGPGAL